MAIGTDGNKVEKKQPQASEMFMTSTLVPTVQSSPSSVGRRWAR